MKGLLKKIFDFILPPRCLMCGKVVSFDNTLCEECLEQIHFISKPYCLHCGIPLNSNEEKDFYCVNCLTNSDNLRLCRAAIQYDDFSKKLILDFKFHDHIENKKLLANWLKMAGKDIFEEGVDLIIPVPLHFSRLFKRKYNQSAMLAYELSHITNIKVDFNSLIKKKYSSPQALCSQKQRLKNVKGTFVVKDNSKIKGKRILLIDDVYTTGSTLKECAKILSKAGAKSVDALTVAKVY